MAEGKSAKTEIRITRAESKADWATIIGLLTALLLIGTALWLGGQAAAFFVARALLIVLGGTAAVPLISHSWHDVRGLRKIVGRSLLQQLIPHPTLGRHLLDVSMIVRTKGVLALEAYQDQFSRDPFLSQAMQLVTDGIPVHRIETLLSQEIDASMARHDKGSGILRRAAEVAPAMGLIGTLVGLVQMLSQLDDPASLGPAMAVALLTTFYGAILGTVILSPLADKLEKRSQDEFMNKQLIIRAALSYSEQENPRQLEMSLNSILPPGERIRYFND